MTCKLTKNREPKTRAESSSGRELCLPTLAATEVGIHMRKEMIRRRIQAHELKTSLTKENMKITNFLTI